MAFLDFLDPRKRLEDGFIAGGPPVLPRVGGPVTPPFALPGPAPMPERPDMRGAETARVPLSSLPDTTAPRNILPPRMNIDTTGMGTAMPKPKTRAEDYEEQKSAYLAGTPGRGKSALRGAGYGLLQGISSGNGLLGAISGALTGAIDPSLLREQQFNQLERPKILERFALEDEEKAQQAAQAKAALEGMKSQADIANTRSQIEDRDRQGRLNERKQRFEENKPQILSPGASVLPPGSSRPSFTAPERAKQPTAAELGVNPENGLSVEEEARASYEGRGGDQYVFDRLPAKIKQLLDKGTTTGADGKEVSADPGEIRAAEREYQTAINRQWQSDLSYTRGATRAKVMGKRGGAPTGTPQSSGQKAATPSRQGQSRSISDLSKRYPKLQRLYGGQ